MEMKLYEKLGVLYWKRFVLCLFIWVPKECRKGTNYFLNDISLKSVKRFRKWLWFNASVHTYGFIQCASVIISQINNHTIFSSHALYVIISLIINLYCVMLQRYNYLRIKKVLKRATRK